MNESKDRKKRMLGLPHVPQHPPEKEEENAAMQLAKKKPRASSCNPKASPKPPGPAQSGQAWWAVRLLFLRIAAAVLASLLPHQKPAASWD
jgi:hypothetical protein